MQYSKDTSVGEAVSAGNGLKSYTVHGSNFEVPSKYTLTKALGYGAFGLVCSAINTETGEKVAIKKIPRVFDDLSDGKRILREIVLLTFMDHDNIVSVKDLFRPRTQQFEDIYFVSELMDTDLQQIIRSKQKLTDDHHQYFIYQVLRALKFIHSANILHLDLKPGNLLVNGNCDLRICDFGSARGFDPSDLTNDGAPRWYQPPELLLLASADGPAIDLWAAGCIFAEMINRKPLFPGRDYINQLNLITDALGLPSEEDIHMIKSEQSIKYLKSLPKKKPVPFKDLFPNCTKTALDFLEKMLVFNPSKRITAEQALGHPYLSQLHDPTDEQVMGSEFTWEYDSQELKEAELRALLWAEILKYHPN
eukprot:NODE_2410_length_1185_cov_48.139887_g2296_i0.p1 GENE.NODE_2410_length_1185_cov_48.139887_g2296_i0~~NODE_2410_length_1185_cov_48.139887_g2296_i0.p1  ORF type:complete len:364 (-),score=92.60 NODE_2410_length_1185_cov_48.139887_g2296_i0:87-1178(-)